jgi:nicotinate dehydrogenase subunit A
VLPDAPVITFSVNGASRTVECSDETPLLYVLRNDLGLLGTRFGCGVGLCGACNVLVDGFAVHSCDTPMWTVAGKHVTTVEGLGTQESPHPLQRALLEEQAFQCGYCSSGIIVTAAALLARRPAADAAAVRTALDGNLCRCGAHNGIVRGVLAARPDGG